MEKIIPNKEFNLDEEVERLRKHSIRMSKLDIVVEILMVLVLGSLLIMIWTTHNQRMSEKAEEEGYIRGFNACIEENNLYDRY